MERIAMSQEERDKLEWLKRARDKGISQREAASKIGVSDRWVRKLLKRMKKQGDRVVVHGLRGRTSNRKITAKVQVRALEILQQPDGHDFGPTFASEQLAKWHGIELSDETLRRWMIQAGLWKSRARKLEQVHCWRPRRASLFSAARPSCCTGTHPRASFRFKGLLCAHAKGQCHRKLPRSRHGSLRCAGEAVNSGDNPERRWNGDAADPVCGKERSGRNGFR